MSAPTLAVPEPTAWHSERARALSEWPSSKKVHALHFCRSESQAQSTLLKGLVGIFQEQLHPTREFHSLPCHQEPKPRKQPHAFCFCPVPTLYLPSPGASGCLTGASNHFLLYMMESERPKAPGFPGKSWAQNSLNTAQNKVEHPQLVLP